MHIIIRLLCFINLQLKMFCLFIFCRCLVDVRRPHGYLMTQIFCGVVLIFFFVVAVMYSIISLKLVLTTKNRPPASHQGASYTDTHAGNRKYHKSARVMLIFVIAFLLQIWPIGLYGIVIFFGTPPLYSIFLVVVSINLSGVFDCVAYTIIRKHYQTVAHV